MKSRTWFFGVSVGVFFLCGQNLLADIYQDPNDEGIVAADDDSTPRYWRWAAIARSRSSLLNMQWPYGRAICEETQAAAQRRAIDRCGSRDCEISVYVQDGCIGAATGYDYRTRMVAEGTASKPFARRIDESMAAAKSLARREAAAAAALQCNLVMTQGRSGDGPCRVRQVFCTWDMPACQRPMSPTE